MGFCRGRCIDVWLIAAELTLGLERIENAVHICVRPMMERFVVFAHSTGQNSRITDFKICRLKDGLSIRL